MELINGPNLFQVVKRDGPQSVGRVAHLALQLCASLAEAHDAGLVHRDVKPENIMLAPRHGFPDMTKLVDFGLAKSLVAGGLARSLSGGMLVGTPLYMAPEVILTGKCDARADIYALGAVLYFALTGVDVFQGSSAEHVCRHHVHSTPIPVGMRMKSAAPVALERAIMSCLEKEPDKRPRSVGELAALLAPFADWPDDHAWAWWARWSKKVATPSRGPIDASAEPTIDLEQSMSKPHGSIAFTDPVCLAR